MQKIDRAKINSAFAKANSKLFFLNLDGILSPLFDLRASLALSGKMKWALEELIHDGSNQVVIVSGRLREDLDAVFGNMPLVLVAEHGGFLREPNEKWKARFPAPVFWKSRMLSAMQALTGLYAGSCIKEKHYSICWHYRLIRSAMSEADVQKILSILRLVPNRNEFFFDHDNYTIEARAVGIDKGTFAAQWMWSQRPFDFILAIGESKSDEDLFSAVGKAHFTIRIGNERNSNAGYWLGKPDEVELFLSTLVSQPISPP